MVIERQTNRIAQLNGDSESNATKKLSLQAKEQFETFRNKSNPEETTMEQILTLGIPFQMIALKAKEPGAGVNVMGDHGRMENG